MAKRDKDVQDALDWFLKEGLLLDDDEEMSVMEYAEGDVSRELDLSAELIAEYIAAYVEYITK